MHENDPRLVIGATAPQRSLTDVTAAHPWTTAARDHLGPSNTMLGPCSAVVSELAAGWESHRGALARDPWLDAGFADRFTGRLRWLTRNVLQPAKLRLSDAEVALLVVFPYLHQAFWTKQAGAVLGGADPAVAAFGTSDDLPEFSTFAAGFGALHRRGARALDAGDPAATGIGWWLWHHWLVRQPECYGPGNIASLLPASIPPPLNAVLTPPRLMELMRAVQLDPAYLRRVDRPAGLKPVAHIAGGSEFEQDVREQLLGYLLVVAHRTAIDPTVLPRVVADHIGIDDGVTPDEVLASIREAAWNGNRTRVLTTDCLHPATALALRDRAAAVDAVLTEIVGAAENSDTLAPLKDMPVHASADGTNPAVGHRFRLADDQIQALLMGEQLYGTPELAIRELYQNALDACRYRQARTAYLSATGTALPPWQGRIDFRQGVDDEGRPFLECSDNGIGMGDRELVDVFAHAGVRFTDLPEYVEEQADWASVGVESFPTSRFGIGVLSYFMLADEIIVTTCRLSRAGRPGQRLEVHIAGPDALFRVQDLGPGEDAGTVVRLRLRPTSKPVRCTDLLSRILWVSDFLVTSDDPHGSQVWEPRQLSVTAPVGSEDPHSLLSGRKAVTIVPASSGRVWWCDTTGAILADGLWAGTTTFGAVLDLSGRDQPRLTVDRKEIIDVDRRRAEEVLRCGIPELLTSSGSPLSHAWLLRLAGVMPRLADEICERAIDARYRPWQVGQFEAPIEIVGCFSGDARVLAAKDPQPTASWSESVRRWRLEAWLRAGEPDSGLPRTVVPALPSDEILLHGRQDARSLGDVLRAAVDTHRSLREVLARLAVLGASVPDPETFPSEVRASDPQLLVRNERDSDVWLHRDQLVPHHHVLRAAAATGMAPVAVIDRLYELGYDLFASVRVPAAVYESDLHLVMTDAMKEWPSALYVLPVAHVMVAAAETGWTPVAVAERLTVLGYDTPDPGTLPESADPDDRKTFVERGPAAPGFVSDPVPPRHVVLVAAATGRPPAQIAARLRAAGFETPPLGDLPEHLTWFDRTIVLDQTSTRRHEPDPLPGPHADVGHVLAAALATRRPPVAVARRLTEFGYVCPPLDCLPDEVDADDLVLAGTTIRVTGWIPGRDVQQVWLRTGRDVSLQHVVIVAAKTAMSPASAAQRLARLGFVTPPDDLDFTVRLEDLRLLSANLDGEPPWLDSDHWALTRADMTVPLGHVLAAAEKLGMTPVEVARRLARLGLRCETTSLPASVERHAARLLTRAVPDWRWRRNPARDFRWLELATPADAVHLMVTAAHTGLSPAEVAARLSALGFAVADPRDLPSSIDRIDLTLLSESLDGRPPYSVPESEFPRGMVMDAVFETGLLPGEVFKRLERLGITVSE